MTLTTARFNYDRSVCELRKTCQRFKDSPPDKVDDRLFDLLENIAAVKENRTTLERVRNGLTTGETNAKASA